MTIIRQVGTLAYSIFLLGMIWIVGPIHKLTSFMMRVISSQHTKVHGDTL
jgi:hypothetical protein